MRSKLTIAFIITILSAAVVILYVMLLSHDVSIQAISNSTNKDPVYLISYSDGPDVYKQNQNAMAASAINKGIDSIFNYRKHHLDKDFVARNIDILSRPTGAGYWLWKPWIILDALNKIPENSILIYGDGNTIFTRPIHDLLELSNSHEMILIEHPCLSREQESQTTTLNALNCTSKECREGRNVIAGFMILRNNKKTRSFIAEWLRNCERAELLIDDNSVSPKLSGHRHDQAILGILVHHHRKDIVLLKYKFIRDNYIATSYRKPGAGEFYSQNSTMFKYSILGRLEYNYSNSKLLTNMRKFIVTHLSNFPWRKTYFKHIDLNEEITKPE